MEKGITIDDISPGFSADYQRYIQLNPAYDSNPQTGKFNHPIVEREMRDIFFSDRESKHERTNDAIGRRIRIIHGVIRSKLSQMEGNELWNSRGPASPIEYKKSDRSAAKTVTDLGVHPTERQAFSREEGNKPETLEGLIFDSRLISDTRLRNLGQERFIAPKGKDMETRAELRNQAVEAVRIMFGSLEPIRRPDEKDSDQLRYFRLYRVGAPVAQEGTDQPTLPRPSSLGYIVGTQHVYTGKKGEKVKQKTLFKTDLYGADMRLKEIDAGYENEIAILKMIDETLRSITANFDKWKELDQADKDRISEILENYVDQLENVDDEDKIKMRELLRRAITLRDKLYRPNPQAKVAQVERARDFLGARLKTIEETWAYLAKDKIKVEQIHNENIQPLVSFMRKVAPTHDQFAILRPDQPLDEGKKTAIIKNLTYLKNQAQKMTFEPLLSFGEKFIQHIDATIAALRSGDQLLAATEFTKMYVLTKVVRSMESLKATYERIALSPETINPDDLEKDLRSQKEILKERTVAPELQTDDDTYYHVYKQINRLYATLFKRLRELKGEQPPTQAEGPSAPQKPSQKAASTPHKPGMTLHKVVNSLRDAVPGLQNFFDKVEARVRGFIEETKRTLYGEPKPQPKNVTPELVAAELPYTMEEKLAKYKEIKAHIKAFDYAAVVRWQPGL